MNRYYWNFRVPGPSEVPGLFVMEAQGGGPAVPPGTYRVKLTVDGKDYAAPLEIKADPRLKTTQADLEKQYQFELEARDRVSEIHNLVNELRTARTSLTKGRGTPAVVEVLKKMSEIESALVQVDSTNRSAALVYPIMLDAQYAELANVAASSDSAPPAQVYEVFQDYEKRREQLFSAWKALQPQIAALQSRLGGAGGQ
jgi:hypothetical protein